MINGLPDDFDEEHTREYGLKLWSDFFNKTFCIIKKQPTKHDATPNQETTNDEVGQSTP